MAIFCIAPTVWEMTTTELVQPIYLPFPFYISKIVEKVNTVPEEEGFAKKIAHVVCM
jgi:hypothetical protein